MDAVAYARFSSANQNDLSIDAQMTAINAAADKNGDRIAAIYQDRAESGTTADREQFMEMFEAIRSGSLKVKKVYVYMFNRFMRNSKESQFFKARLEALDVDVVSAMQPLPEEQYMADFMEGMIELSDKLTSDMIGIHVRSGMQQLVSRSYWTGGPAPFGYAIKAIDSREGHMVKGEIVKRAILVPYEAEAVIVRRIFELAATIDAGGHRIYQILSQELGRDVLGRSGSILDGRGVNQILRKAIYKGLFIYGAYSSKLVYDEDPNNERRMRKKRITTPQRAVTKQIEEWRLVSDEIWEAAQRNRAKNIRANFGHGPRKAAYLLTGLMQCGLCGNGVGGHWQQNSDGTNRYHYYRCRGAMHGAMRCTNRAKVRGAELEAAVVQQIEMGLFSEAFLQGVVDEVVRLKQQVSAKFDGDSLLRQRDELSAKIVNLTRVAAVAINVPEISQQLADLSRQRNAIEGLLAQERHETAPMDRQAIVAQATARLGRTMALLTTAGDLDQLRLELKKWIEAIRLDADGSLWLKWRDAAVFELLQLEPVSVNGEEGSPFAVNGYCQPLDAWHQLNLDAKYCGLRKLRRSETRSVAPAANAIKVSGFSGFSGQAGASGLGFSAYSGFSGYYGSMSQTKSDGDIVGFSAASGNAATVISGFSGISN